LHDLLLRQGTGKPLLRRLRQAVRQRLPKPPVAVRAGGQDPQKKEGKEVLTITIQVNAPSGQAIGIKEDIAAYLEKFGDARVVSVVEKLPEQLRMDSPPQRGAGPAERTRQAVYATGNKWAIENFEATHG
jgi:hypothetical protein